ncbi:MAG: zf-HC2 domain-containing protein [Dysosmobacter welbionis]
MKNIPELSCAIVEDLLPTYVERLTSEETDMAVEAHLASCPACAAKRTAMGAKETEAAGQNAEETAREVDYLKKVRRRNRRRVWLAVACTTLVLAAGFAAQGVYHRLTSWMPTEWQLSLRKKTIHCGFTSLPGSGNAFWDWTVDNQDGVVTITARSVLVSPLFRDGGGTVEVPLEGVTEIWLGRAGWGRMIWQDDVVISADAWALYQSRTPYAGENSLVGRALAAVDTWYGPIVDYTISLQTTRSPMA